MKLQGETAMTDIGNMARPFELLARGANSLQSLFLLATRWYVSWQFLKSGWIKVTSWQSTLELFRDEYHVPLLPPYAAAVTGAFGELFFSTLVILGIGGRIAPLGLFAVNAMAVISYPPGATGGGVRGGSGATCPLGIHAGDAHRFRKWQHRGGSADYRESSDRHARGNLGR